MNSKQDRTSTLFKIDLISKILLTLSILAVIGGAIMMGFNLVHLANSISAGVPRAEYAEHITNIARGIFMMIHYFLVSKFFVIALMDGKVFTHETAKELRVIGWETIIVPFLVAVVSIIAYGGTKPLQEIIELEIYEIILGIFLIQTGYVLDYGTDHISKKKNINPLEPQSSNK